MENYTMKFYFATFFCEKSTFFFDGYCFLYEVSCILSSLVVCSGQAKGNGTKQIPLKKTLIFLFLDFLRGVAMAVFMRKHNNENLHKIRKPKSFVIIRILAFFVFL